MGDRLTKIYTRTGDSGKTGLADGSRVDKDGVLIQVIGEIDELNCAIGVVISQVIPESVSSALTKVQHDLFTIGGELSMKGQEPLITQQHVEWLESTLDVFNSDLPPLKEFVLPGGGKAAARCHVARAVCRRTERALVALSKTTTVNQYTRNYLNRLSDLLFVLCRVLATATGNEEILWDNPIK